VADAAAPGAGAALPEAVRVRESPAGRYLVGASSAPLYVYAQDSRPGKSACNGECAKAWPPLAAPSSAAPTGEFAPVARDDGVLQWAWRGQPLYAYAKDRATGNPDGNPLGERVGNAWSLAFEPIRRPPGFAVRSLFVGRVLADARGYTLYWRSDEAPQRGGVTGADGGAIADSRCSGACLERWVPASAPLLANRVGDWQVAPRADGTRQWAFRGRRLYALAGETRPGRTTGQGLDKVWEVALLEPAPPLPSWVTVQNSDMGEIFADAKGMTLYTFTGSLERTRKLLCDEACLGQFWRVLRAGADAKPSGEWTLVESTPDNTAGLPASALASPPAARTAAAPLRVWAYKGNVLYTHVRDREPGGISGDKWATGAGGLGAGFNPIQLRRDYED
jgi:predicted lipoprotein with Yx(FWY)xxD motif